MRGRVVAGFVGLWLAAAAAMAADVEGSEDHPLITRYPGSEIQWYEVQNFAPYRIAVGPVTGYRTIDDWIDTKGRVTRILYSLKDERSFYEVYENYLSAVKKGGFDVLAEGVFKERNVAKTAGGRGWQGVHYAANPFPTNGQVPFMQGSATQGGCGSFAAKLVRPENTVYVALGALQFTEDEVLVMLDIVEEEAMEDDLVFVDAEAMGKDIDSFGKVALYGIFFDHDKATMKADSKPALDEIAKLLEMKPDLSVYVVGHTDSTGKLAYNLDLSKRRAQAIVDALIADYAVAAERLDAHGVGPLVPVMANSGDTGKAKNRRVELVER